MLLVSRAENYAEIGTVLAAMTLVILITGAALFAAGWIMKLMGERIEAMISRLLGVILAALAAQFVVDGLRQSFPALSG
jgi:multiple antibiotic resistance protein